MAEKRSSPPLSVWVIGLAAMIPFVASAIAFRWGHAPLKGRALEALLAYAAVILAFYGGIRAGLEIGRPRPRWSTLSLALAVPLVAWGLLLGVGRPTDLFKLSGGSVFVGGISKPSGELTLDVAKGVLGLNNTDAVAVKSLNVGEESSLLFNADPSATDPALRNGALNVAGTATLAKGARIGLSFASRLTGPQSFTVIKAGSLNNLGADESLLGNLPYIYSADLVTTSTALPVSSSHSPSPGRHSSVAPSPTRSTFRIRSRHSPMPSLSMATTRWSSQVVTS